MYLVLVTFRGRDIGKASNSRLKMSWVESEWKEYINLSFV